MVLSACTNRNATADREKLFHCLSLDPKKDYIFYEVKKSNEEYELWAFDTTDKKSVQVPEPLHSVQMSSPPGRDLLLFNNHSINILDLESCEARSIYKVESVYKYFYAVWLGEDVVLISAFEHWPFSPDLYILDLGTKKAEKVASEKFIQAVSSTHSTWIQDDGITLEAVHWQGSTVEIFEEFSVDTEVSPGAIEFLPNSDEFIFVAAREGSTDYKVWKSSLKGSTPQVPFEPEKDSSIAYRQLSPGGKYLGLVEQTLEGSSLRFLNLKTNRIDYEWPYPFTRTNPEFRWSPDSKFIVMPYEGTDDNPPDALFSGIQIMEIRSGKIDVVLREDFMWLFGWYSAR
jgi:hypothetical protein